MVTLTNSNRLAVAAVTLMSALAGFGGVADAATTHHHRKHAKRHSTAQSSTTSSSSSSSTTATDPASGRSNPEVELTGDTATKAKAAALAAVSGTVWRASTEDPSDASGAAYEVHVTKDDGTEVEVLLDSSFAVVKIQDSPQKAPGAGGGGCSHDGGTGQGTGAGTYP